MRSPSLRSALVGAIAMLAAGARADEGGPLAAEPSVRYFAGERDEGYAWMAAGDASLAGGAAMLAQEGSRVLRGMSYPLLAVGAIQLVAGLSSLARAESRGEALRLEIARDGQPVVARERARVDRLNFLFRVIRYTELTLVGVGAAGAVLSGALGEQQLLGASLGVVVEAGVMLALDHFAEARAHRYAEALRGVSVALTPQTVTLGFSRSF